MIDNAADHQEIFDRQLIKRRRERAAASGNPADFLLAHVAEDFTSRISMIRRTFAQVLELGAHTGILGRRLAGIPGIERIIQLDDSEAMLRLCNQTRVLAHEEALPFAPGAFDLIVSALKLQFLNDLPGVLIQARQCLKPDGLFLAAILGPATLGELREALLEAEEELSGGISLRVAPFVDIRQAGSLLQRAGFALPVTDAEILQVTYETPLHLMRDLRAMGATNPLTRRFKKQLGRATLMRAAEIYCERASTPEGRVSATFEIITLTGWAPHENQQKPLPRGTAEISLTEILKPRHQD